MRNALRDFFRRRRVRAYVRAHGNTFDYHGVSVKLPMEAAGLSAMNALIRGKYERDEAALIVKHLPSDRPVIELGGSLGVVSALIASRLAPGTPHVVVEANASLVPICRSNSGGQAEVINAAVAYDGPVARFRIGSDIHANALEGQASGGVLVEVEAVTLATLVARLAPARHMTLVADIEGAEFDIFESDGEALSAIALAIIEIHPRTFAKTGRSEQAFLDLAARAGLRPIDRSADVVVLARATA